MNPGKVTIVAILAVGVAAAGFSWWFRWQRGAEVLHLWGSEAAIAIRVAPEVELLHLVPLGAAAEPAPELVGDQGDGLTGSIADVGERNRNAAPQSPALAAAEAAEVLTIDGQRLVVRERQDISDARGLIHVRYVLLQREALQPIGPEGVACRAEWPVALRFRKAATTTTVAIDWNCQAIQAVEMARGARVPAIIDGLRLFVDEQQDRPRENSPAQTRAQPQ